MRLTKEFKKEISMEARGNLNKVYPAVVVLALLEEIEYLQEKVNTWLDNYEHLSHEHAKCPEKE